MIDGNRERRRADRDRNVARDGRRQAARIGNAAHVQPAESQVGNADDVAFGGRRIEIVHALRRERAIAAERGDQVAKSRDYDRPAAQDRAFLNHKGGRGDERARRGAEHVPAHVEGVVVYAERVVVEELARVAASDRILLYEVERPDRAPRDDARAGRVRDGDQQAIGRIANVVDARHVDDVDEPALRRAVVADAGVAREVDVERAA